MSRAPTLPLSPIRPLAGKSGKSKREVAVAYTTASSTSEASLFNMARNLRAEACFTDLCRGEDLPPVLQAFCVGASSTSRALPEKERGNFYKHGR